MAKLLVFVVAAFAISSTQAIGLTRICIRKSTVVGQDLYLRGGKDTVNGIDLATGGQLQWLPPNDGIKMTWSGKVNGIDNWCVDLPVVCPLSPPTYFMVKGYLVDNNNGQKQWEPNTNAPSQCTLGNSAGTNPFPGSINHPVMCDRTNEFTWGESQCTWRVMTRVCIRKNAPVGAKLYLRGGADNSNGVNLYDPYPTPLAPVGQLQWIPPNDGIPMTLVGKSNGIDNWCVDLEADVYKPPYFQVKGFMVEANGVKTWESNVNQAATCTGSFSGPAIAGMQNHYVRYSAVNQFDWGLGSCVWNNFNPIDPTRNCTLFNDPHIITWDNQAGDYHKPDLHYIAKLCEPVAGIPNFAVSGLDVPCAPTNPNGYYCLNHVYYEVTGLKVDIDGKGAVSVNNAAITLPYYGNGVTVMSNGAIITLKTNFGLTIEYFIGSTVHVNMSSTLALATIEKVTGICGRHNYKYGDDYENITGPCNPVPPSPPIPCPVAILDVAKQKCDDIINATGSFAQCYVPCKQQLYQSCLDDYCGTSSIDQVCVTFGLLESMCKASRFPVGDWSTKLGCAKRCTKPGEIWYKPGCQTVCQCNPYAFEVCWQIPPGFPPTMNNTVPPFTCTTVGGRLAYFRSDGVCGDGTDTWRQRYTCCNSGIFPRYDNSTVQRTNTCCNNYAYLGADFVCCQGGNNYQILARNNTAGVEVQNKCCGSAPYLGSAHDCCNATLSIVAPKGQCGTVG